MQAIDIMRELSKKDYRDAKDVLKKGILRLHEQWLNKLAKLLASPYKDQEKLYAVVHGLGADEPYQSDN